MFWDSPGACIVFSFIHRKDEKLGLAWLSRPHEPTWEMRWSERGPPPKTGLQYVRCNKSALLAREAVQWYLNAGKLYLISQAISTKIKKSHDPGRARLGYFATTPLHNMRIEELRTRTTPRSRRHSGQDSQSIQHGIDC